MQEFVDNPPEENGGRRLRGGNDWIDDTGMSKRYYGHLKDGKPHGIGGFNASYKGGLNASYKGTFE